VLLSSSFSTGERHGLGVGPAAWSSRSEVNESIQPQAWPWGDFCVDSFTVENEPPAGEISRD